LDDRYIKIFVRVIVILNYDMLADEHIALQVDAILAGYNTAVAYAAVVIDDNRRLASRIVGGDAEPRMLQQAYRITKADSGGPLPTHLTREMKRHITAYGGEWIRQTDPGAIHLRKSARKKFQWVRKWPTIVGMLHVYSP
jgi:hypothetical protein